MSLCETYSRVTKVTIATIIIRICALKAGARVSTAISLLSSRASIPRKTNNPAVRLRKSYTYWDLTSNEWIPCKTYHHGNNAYVCTNESKC